MIRGMETIYDVLKFIVNSLRGQASEQDIAQALAVIEKFEHPATVTSAPAEQEAPSA